jgi:hypothetical protein
MALPSPRVRERIAELLSYPEYFPDEFKGWLTRWLNQNRNLRLQRSQLPFVEDRHEVAAVGALNGEPEFENGATNHTPGAIEPVGFYQDEHDRVYLAGLGKDGTNNTAWFTLPANYRPRFIEQFRVDMFRGGAYIMGRVDVYPDGRVIPIALEGAGTLGYVSFSGISFRVA